MTTRPRILKAEYRHTKNGPAKITSDNERKAIEAVSALFATAVIVILILTAFHWKGEAERNAASLRASQATVARLRDTDAKRKSEIDGLKQAAIDKADELADVNDDLDAMAEQLRQTKREVSIWKVKATKSAAPTKKVNRKVLESSGGWKTAKSSWYGPGFYGNALKNGTKLTSRSMGVAHRTLPIGTKVTFRNPDNGKTVTVAVVDRGPYVASRMWDLCPGTAAALGMFYTGTIQYKIGG